MYEVKVLRVFVNEEGKFGNPVGIVVDQGEKITQTERQKIAKELGFSESVFVDDLASGEVSIYNPEQEVEFAGHALVGTAYYLHELLNLPVERIKCKAGFVNIGTMGDITSIKTSLVDMPPWLFKELDGPDEVNDLTFGQRKRLEHTVVWAYVDKVGGIVRARTFAPDWGIPEDEANGSGAMQLAYKLGMDLEVRHGKGSVIYAKPIQGNMATVGGRVIKD